MSRSEKFWDKSAARYAKSAISDEASYQKKLTETQAFLTPNMHILEFGCGTGTTAVHHAPHVQHIDAVDISENMLEIGRDNAKAAGVENISFSRGTLTEFDAASGTYDAVLGLNVIHLVPDRQAVVAEVARILKPGGIFITSTPCLGHSYLRFIKLIAPLANWLGLMPDVFIMTELEWAHEVTNAGFTIERQWNHGESLPSVFLVARKT